MIGGPRALAGLEGARRTSIVTGAEGQDGHYLAAALLACGSVVHATALDTNLAGDLARLPGADDLHVHQLDVTDHSAARDLIAELQPDELYNLAGDSSVARSFADPIRTWLTNADAVLAMLEAVRLHSPQTRFYQSSSTDMFGSVPGEEVVHDDASRLAPLSPYAAAKAAAHLACDAYRRAYGLRIACGILANHESRRRPPGFLTRKVVDHVRAVRAEIDVGQSPPPPLYVGNLAAQRDWGFAPEYVEGMIRVCRQIEVRAAVMGGDPEPDVGFAYRDYVLGSGMLHPVWALVDRAFSLAGIPLAWDRSSSDPSDWTAVLARDQSLAVVVDPDLVRRSDPHAIGVDPSRARRELGWNPHQGLDAFLEDMLWDVIATPSSP